ncbi:MAG: PaaI family thioesterase [Acidimicrobiia bacterium]|nr:PaaI family thioesterase [Acidimicrobiia bacterium]
MSADDSTLALDARQLNEFLDAAFPDAGRGYRVESADLDGIRMRLPFDDDQLRPGGTISGPTMMSLADAAAWLVTLSRIGPEAMSVTSSLSIHFLAKPEPADLWAEARLLRLGARQSVSEVRLWTDGGDPAEPVAHATVAYAIPRPRTG